MAGARTTNIQKRRRLQALYEKGKDLRFNSADGQPVIKTEDDEPLDTDIVVYVCPPSPLQREMAIREAQGQRARVMLEAREQHDSNGHMVARNFLVNLDMDALIDYVLDIDETERTQKARREVLLEKEWEDFNTLRDTMRQFEEAGSPYDDPEWKAFLERDRKFGDQVYEKMNEIRIADREGLALMPRPELEKRALDKRIEQSGTSIFMKFYEEWMLFYACRDGDDHTMTFFEDVEDMRSMPEEVQEALQDTLNSFITDSAEAKNSEAVGSGSASSEPPKEPEMSASSTPEDAIGF